MATKKEKRRRALEKREKFMEAYRREGLEALARDRAERARKAREAEERAKRTQQRNKTIAIITGDRAGLLGPVTQDDLSKARKFVDAMLLGGWS